MIVESRDHSFNMTCRCKSLKTLIFCRSTKQFEISSTIQRNSTEQPLKDLRGYEALLQIPQSSQAADQKPQYYHCYLILNRADNIIRYRRNLGVNCLRQQSGERKTRFRRTVRNHICSCKNQERNSVPPHQVTTLCTKCLKRPPQSL